MILTDELTNHILIQPAINGADHLRIIAGYATLEELLNAAFAVSNKEEYERRRIEFCKDYQDSLLCVLSRSFELSFRRTAKRLEDKEKD